ncbi:sigma-54-dependent Fis family transcriptional regulator [Streptomyces spiralis]|uniref:sigma-54-dependent Fis family transcriptional regulator n=1 Tax=Streptomyces spiralis TaxID=66376 RepID=UPI0036A2F657
MTSNRREGSEQAVGGSRNKLRDARELAAARERFLSAGTVDTDQVRQTIAASWWRSRTWKITADHLRLPYVKDPNLDTPLVRGAGPILQRLQEQLSDEPVSLILTDPSGTVLDRRTTGSRLEQRLDQVQLAPGFSYAERFVGTNGIGTALEGGQATGVFGPEHYAEDLEDLSCAGVPVRHPVSGRLLGVFDLTCWSHDASPLLLTLAKTTAQQIEQELTTLTGLREFALFQEYLRACQHSGGIVFALNNDVVMMNDHARKVLSASDQAALLTTAAEAMLGSKRVTIDVALPGGERARMFCAPVHTASGPAGGVVRVRLTGPASPPATVSFQPVLPGLAGSSPAWRRTCELACAHYRKNEWITLKGEAGTGKLALLRAVHRHHNPSGSFHVLDASGPPGGRDLLASLKQELEQSSGGTLVLQHIDCLPTGLSHAFATLLHQHRRLADQTGQQWWVAATHRPITDHNGLDDLLRLFPASVEVPPLRHHTDDLNELVPFLLGKLDSTSGLTASRAALQLLMRHTWPGNVAQLQQILSSVAQRRRSGVIQPSDLPPECQTVARRVLTPLESLERDAMVRSLIEAGGNKNKAARALGISRATIYRKIREYGIDIPK